MGWVGVEQSSTLENRKFMLVFKCAHTCPITNACSNTLIEHVHLLFTY